MGSFYVLNTTQAADLRLYAGGQWVNGTRRHCAICGAFTDSSEPLEIQIALDHLGKRGFTEYLWNSHSLPLFREDLCRIWGEAGLTGYVLKPVCITGWSRHPTKAMPSPLPVYYRLLTISRVRLATPPPVGECCPACGFSRYAFPATGTHLESGIEVDIASWDGSDLFGLAGYQFVFCTRRVAEITLRAGYNRHVVFIRERDYERWQDFDYRVWTAADYDKHVEGFLIRRAEDLDIS